MRIRTFFTCFAIALVPLASSAETLPAKAVSTSDQSTGRTLTEEMSSLMLNDGKRNGPPLRTSEHVTILQVVPPATWHAEIRPQLARIDNSLGAPGLHTSTDAWSMYAVQFRKQNGQTGWGTDFYNPCLGGNLELGIRAPLSICGR
jgi:hypothetical protein